MAVGSGFTGFEPLRRSISGELFEDGFTRGRYATDASIYQMMPHGVVIPKTIADIEATIVFCREQGTALLPRGGGTSQCGPDRSITRLFSITQNTSIRFWN
jgi:FAD/FMN-containing dehydrogenase